MARPDRISRFLGAGALALAVLNPAATKANSWLENTQLVGARAGGGHSNTVVAFRQGGYTLSDGTPIVFSRWYSSANKDMSMLYLTPIRSNFGVFWGFSTGESGEKYRIDPSLTAGLMNRVELSRNSEIALSVTTVIGGYLTERPCQASYGAVGGTQPVNCRLAATPMPPSRTLQNLFRVPPPDQLRVSVRYRFQF